MLVRAVLAAALGCAALLGALAVVIAPGSAVVAVAFGAIAAGGASLWASERVTGDAVTKTRVGRRAGLFVGVTATGGWLVLTAVVLLMGPATGAVALTTALVSGAVWLSWRGGRDPVRSANPLCELRDRALRAAQDTGSRSAGEDAAEPASSRSPVQSGAPSAASWPTPQLCLAWHRTYFVLLDLPSGASRAEIVSTREQILAEIERRDPEGFSRWLDAGARAGSDPGRYLAGDR